MPPAGPEDGPELRSEPSDQLRILAGVLGQETVARLVAQFCDDLTTTEARLLAAATASDRATVDTHLHTFKGAAGTLGFAALARQSQILRDLPAPDAAACTALMKAARQAVAAVQK